MLGIFALANLGLTTAAPATIAGLCAKLTSGVCAGWHFNTALTTATACEGIFGGMGLTLGDDTDTTANTIGCRIYWANQATSNTTAYNCRYAGITGAGQCGNYTVALDNACNGIIAACGDATTNAYGAGATGVAACKDGTNGLGSRTGYWGSTTGPSGANEDTIECRVYHSTVGNATGPNSAHCGHTAAARPASGWCDMDAMPNTEHYCRTTQTHCVGARQQYNSQTECEASFAAFPVANLTTTNANTQGCRQYHINVAATVGVVAGDGHCTHGGPSGGTQCGTSHEAWRSLASIPACATAFPSLAGGVNGAFLTWNMADVTTVVPAGTGANIATNYSVGMVGDNAECRLYHLTVATGLPSHCEHGSLTSSTCYDGNNTPSVHAACRMALSGCPSAFTDQNACVGAYTPILGARPGDPNAPTGDTIACRLFYAATALAQKRNATSTTASCANLAATGAPGCGGGGPAKSDASTLLVSFAAFLLPFAM